MERVPVCRIIAHVRANDFLLRNRQKKFNSLIGYCVHANEWAGMRSPLHSLTMMWQSGAFVASGSYEENSTTSFRKREKKKTKNLLTQLNRLWTCVFVKYYLIIFHFMHFSKASATLLEVAKKKGTMSNNHQEGLLVAPEYMAHFMMRVALSMNLAAWM